MVSTRNRTILNRTDKNRKCFSYHLRKPFSVAIPIYSCPIHTETLLLSANFRPAVGFCGTDSYTALLLPIKGLTMVLFMLKSKRKVSSVLTMLPYRTMAKSVVE